MLKDAETLAAAMCACGCDRRPETLDPLPEGWGWDTAEKDNPWLWCPDSMPAGTTE